MKISSVLPSHRGRLADLRFALLALMMLAVASAGVRAQSPSTTAQTHSAMQKFVIIFRQGPRPLTDADKLRRQQEVSAWARLQNAAGHKLEPRILAPEVARRGTGAASVTSNGTADWPVTALLFLEASDLAEAAKVAGTHPALGFGVSVEVRPWAPPAILATP